MSQVPAIVTLASVIAMLSPFDLMLDGYRVLWSGNAIISGCVDEEDRYELGPYRFVCDMDINAHPYRRGTVYLMGRDGEDDGPAAGFLCINQRDGCYLGTIEPLAVRLPGTLREPPALAAVAHGFDEAAEGRRLVPATGVVQVVAPEWGAPVL